jgi:twinkle protein
MNLEEKIISLNDVEQTMDDHFKNGQKVGTTTYFENSIDTCWKWRTGEFNLWTGYMGEGKTELLKQLAIIKALKEGKKFAFFSPENMPADEFFTELIFPLIGKNPYKHSQYFNLTEGDYKTAKNFLKEHFFIVHPKSRKLTDIEDGFKELKNREPNLFGCVLDPFLKISHDRDTDASYISDFMARCSDFSKELDVSYSLVAHQLTPQIDPKTNNYIKPDPYKIKGGGNFADGADNILLVWRPNKRTDRIDTTVHFESAKIKRHELVSKPNDIILDFDSKNKWYRYGGINPIETHWSRSSDIFKSLDSANSIGTFENETNLIAPF